MARLAAPSTAPTGCSTPTPTSSGGPLRRPALRSRAGPGLLRRGRDAANRVRRPPRRPGSFFERITVREKRAPACGRSSPTGPSPTWCSAAAPTTSTSSAARTRGRAARCCAESATRDPDDDRRLIFAPVFPLRVIHFPLRSFDQYQRRVEVDARRDLRRTGPRAASRALRRRAPRPRCTPSSRSTTRRSRRDVTRRHARARRAAARFCPACADGGDGPHRRRSLGADGSEAERADVAFEAMRALTRTQQGLIRQRDDLRRRANRKQRKLDQAEAAASSDRGRRHVGRIAAMLGRSGGRK